MKKYILNFLGIALVSSFVACDNTAKTTEENEETTEEVVEEIDENSSNTQFGELIEAENAISIDEFSTAMEGKDSLEVKLFATAKDVCKKKGCWMKVEKADGSMMRVTFKDYGFFVPKDITGKNVIIEGTAYADTVSVEDLKHYAEDGGESPEAIAAITEPEIATTFVAKGVIIQE